VCYVCGYEDSWYASNGNKDQLPINGIAIHVDHDRFIFFEESDELILARNTSIATEIRVIPRSNGESVVAALNDEGWLGGTAGLELWSYRPNPAISHLFQEILEHQGCTVVDGTDIVRDLRAVKSPQELSCIETAARIPDVGMQSAIGHAQPGMTEIEVHAEVLYAMAKVGGELNAIPGLVNSGPRTCSHGHTSRRRIMPGDLVTLDICGVYNRYHANVSRTVSMGPPSPAVVAQIELSSKSMDLLRSTVRPYLPVAELNRVMKDYCENAGIWEDR
jgi:Xaa-Pro aminopeptidase